jgi:hypothetical protein
MEKDIAKNAKTNLKKFWQYANSKRKTKSGIAELKYKNDKANSFLISFSSKTLSSNSNSRFASLNVGKSPSEEIG